MKDLVLLLGICCLPLKILKVTSSYGYRIHPFTGRYTLHEGIDLSGRSDTVFSVFSGIVTVEKFNQLLGVYIRLDHGDYQLIYGHLSRVFVLPGDSVEAGEPIAITGSTGRVTGEHLHFSVRHRHQFINPMAFLLAIIKSTGHE